MGSKERLFEKRVTLISKEYKFKMALPSQQDGNLTLVCYLKLDRKTLMHIKCTKDKE